MAATARTAAGSTATGRVWERAMETTIQREKLERAVGILDAINYSAGDVASVGLSHGMYLQLVTIGRGVEGHAF